MRLLCNVGKCNNEAQFGDRLYADPNTPDTLYCMGCYLDLDRDGQIDVWPLRTDFNDD